VPFVGCHGGALLGVTAEEYLKSSDLTVKGAVAATEKYRADGIPVAFDLQIEAEALGCRLQWSSENPPAVVSHVLDEKKLSDLMIPGPDDGRIPVVTKAAAELRRALPDTALYGLITGPFTLALHLKGTEIFMDMFDNPGPVKELLDFCAQVGIRMADYYMEAGCDIIAIVDPMTSQISPDAFRTFVTAPAAKVFDHIREQGRLSSFFVCGHAQKNVEAMCECGPDNVSVDENIPLSYVRDICRAKGVSFGGNLKLTVGLLFGSPDDIRRNVIECMDMGKREGFILAPGCDIPYATPPENLALVSEMVFDGYQQDVARQLLETEEQVTVDLDLSDYGQIESEKVIVDIITLDSEACAPCQYMVEAVKAAMPHFDNLVEWREHKIKEKESVEFMMAMMVKNIPTICIDGTIAFVSTIPSRDELIAAIQRRINEKFGRMIKKRRGRVLVLGGGCAACAEVYDRCQKAIMETGSEVELIKVSDEEAIAEYGVSVTPAIIISRDEIKSEGRTPSVEVIAEWLKSL
ncbi:MAG: MTH895/ArsE family thioredoxin-like protein, partial [bacterium]|nr:MTH895/ArsE family thioredoxin-like protein [bacterium]